MNALYDLIHSLDKAEKRGFKLFIKQFNSTKDKKYLILFDHIDKLKQPDEQLLIKLLQAKKYNTKYLAADKQYLNKIILKSLKNVDRNQFHYEKLLNELLTIQILYNKGLMSQGKKILKKAFDLANKHELVNFIPELLQWEKKFSPPSNTKELMRFKENIDFSLKRINETNQLDSLYYESLFLRKSYSKTRDLKQLEQFNEILNNPFLAYGIKHDSTHAQIRHYQIRILYYATTNKIPEQYLALLNLLELLEKTPFFNDNYPLEYVQHTSDLLIILKKINIEAYQKQLAKFAQFPKQVKKEQKKITALVFQTYYGSEVVRWIHQGDFASAHQQIDTIKEGIQQNKKSLSRAAQLTFFYLIAYIHFGKNEITLALDHLSHALNSFSEKDRPDLYPYIELFSIICHFELKNYQFVNHKLRVLVNRFKQKHHHFRTEKQILTCLRKCVERTPSKETTYTYFSILYNELVEYQKNVNPPILLLYFDYLTYAKSKITNKTFEEIKKEHVHLF